MKKHLITILFISILISANFAEEAIDSHLYKVNVDGKMGFINKTGQMIIAPQYDMVNDFSDGLAAVMLYDEYESKWGYINKTGNEVIPLKFGIASDFSDGYATVRESEIIGEGELGLINKAGQFVFQPPCLDLGPVKEGFFTYSTGPNVFSMLHGYARVDGTYLTEQIFEQAFPFSEGRARVVKDGLYGFIDTEGKVIIPLSFYVASDFHDGLASVMLEEDSGWIFIDKNGDQVFTGNYDIVNDFSEGYAVVNIGPEWWLINKKGDVVLNLVTFVTGVSEGLIPYSENDKYGYIDLTGKFVIEPNFNYATDFHNGLAEVEIFDEASQQNVKGYINKQGKFIWKTQ